MQNLKRGEIFTVIPIVSLPVQFQMPFLSESQIDTDCADFTDLGTVI